MTCVFFLQLGLFVSHEPSGGCRLHLTLSGDENGAVSVALTRTAYSPELDPAASFKKIKRELTVLIPWSVLEASCFLLTSARRDKVHCVADPAACRVVR